MKFTEEQRLIVMMLADIQKSSKVQGELDADFIAKVASDGHEFAISYRYEGTFSSSQEDLPEGFRFVIDVLDMWSFVEDSLLNLSEHGRTHLEASVGKHALTAKFDGFDGNNETELMSFTRLIVQDLQRFTEFAGRDFNSHSPREGRYQAMLDVFGPIRDQLGDRYLDSKELSKILSAM